MALNVKILVFLTVIRIQLWGKYNWNPFTVLLWQCQWYSYAFYLINMPAEPCVDQYSRLGEELIQTLQCRLKMVYQVGNPYKEDQRVVTQFFGVEGCQPVEICGQVSAIHGAACVWITVVVAKLCMFWTSTCYRRSEEYYVLRMLCMRPDVELFIPCQRNWISASALCEPV
jgi:hypothetical protein